jgi:predicted nucleotidyltransferase
MDTGFAAGFRRRVEAQRECRRALSDEILGRLKAAAREAAAEFPSMQRMTLFGSAAAGRAEAASDADVLVEGLRPEEYFSLRRFLAERLEREVDLHSDTEPAHFVRKVRERGACVYERKA